MKKTNEFSHVAHTRGPHDAAHARDSLRCGPRSIGPCEDGMWRGNLARADILTKMPLDYEQNNPQSMLLFLEIAPMQKVPCTLSSLQWHGPWIPPRAPARRAVALATAPATRDPC